MEDRIEQVVNRYYPFNVTSKGDHWHIVFPDLPGCHTTAYSWEEIGKQARKVLVLWVQFQVEEGLPVPPPSRGAESNWWNEPSRPTVLTVGDMAENLGVSDRRVRAIAKARGIGRRVGKALVFDVEDIDRMKPGPAGRPKKATSAA